MNNLRLLTGLLSIVLSGGGVCAYGQSVITLEQIFESAETNLQRDNIRFGLTGFYLDIYKYSNLRGVVKNNLAAARKVLREMRARYEQGTALQNDITRYELLVSNLELQLVRINNTIDILNANLVTTAGLPEGTVVVPDSTIFTSALRKWRCKTMAAIAFALAGVYLAYFYFFIDYGVEKEMLFVPLFFRVGAAVIISIVFLTSIVQSGLPFQVFPQALTINGFTGAVMGATLGPAVIGELLRHAVAKNAALLGANISNVNPDISPVSLGGLYGMVQRQAMVVSMKEIFGWLLIIALASLSVILVSYSSVRPFAIFPKWSTVRRVVRHMARADM